MPHNIIIDLWVLLLNRRSMEDNQYKSLGQEKLQQAIDRLIDSAVDAKVTRLMQYGQHNIDISKIRNETEIHILNKIEEEISSKIVGLQNFMGHLEYDAPLLYQRVRSWFVQPSYEPNSLEALRSHSQFVLDPVEKEQFYSMGMKWFLAKDYSRAISYFDFLSLNDRKNADAWFAKGLAEQMDGKIQEALQSYRDAITAAPQFLTPYVQMMDCMLQLGRRDEACRIYDSFIRDTTPSEYPEPAFFQTKLEAIKLLIDS